MQGYCDAAEEDENALSGDYGREDDIALSMFYHDFVGERTPASVETYRTNLNDELNDDSMRIPFHEL